MPQKMNQPNFTTVDLQFLLRVYFSPQELLLVTCTSNPSSYSFQFQGLEPWHFKLAKLNENIYATFLQKFDWPPQAAVTVSQ